MWRTLDLFCGAAGGWSLGLHRAGFETVAACEIDPWRRSMFGRNNPNARLYEDIRTLDAEGLLADLGFLPEIVCGSPPCQDASAANVKGRGVDGERTGLFFEAVRLVREVRPRWVLLENVPGLRTRGYDRVHDALETAGYAVWPLVVGAVHAGAPHLRKRVWIVALAKSAQEQMGRTGFARPQTERLPAESASLHGIAIARHQSDRIAARASADAEERARRTGLRQDDEIADRRVVTDLGRTFGTWNGGAPDLGRVDNGISQTLATRRGLGRACLAAYGDAVLPQITEAIGRAVRAIDPS